MPIACITGAASGIGLETARLLDEAGFTVYGLSTSRSGAAFLHEQVGDITRKEDREKFISWVMQESGHIDVLVNCAGISIASPIEYTKTEQISRLFEVNLLGTIAMCQAVLPIMRKSHAGCILNISSVAGMFPLPYEAFYASSKAALIAFSRALRTEVKHLGIRVAVIVPGGVRTPFTFKRIKYPVESAGPYAEELKRMIIRMDIEEQTGLWPCQVAKTIVHVVVSRKDKPLWVSGNLYKIYLLLNRLLPARWVDGVIALKYTKLG